MQSWEQGEHVAVIGDTGSGKTFLLSKLLEPGRYRDYVIVLRTKLRDDSFSRFRGYQQIRSLRDIRVSQSYYVLAPPRPKLKEETVKLLEMCDRAGGWTVVIDELFYLTEKLKLGDYMDDLLTQGRSSGLTIVTGMQRPVRITRFAIGMARHVFAFEQEGRDAQELSYATSRALRDAVESLDAYQFAYFNRRDRKRIVIDRAQNLGRVLRERSHSH